MERRDQIKQAAIRRGCIEKTAEFFGFIEGAEWADRNVVNPWHDYNESPENNTYVLTYNHGQYLVMLYRDSMYEYPDLSATTRVDRWMYIPGNTK